MAKKGTSWMDTAIWYLGGIALGLLVWKGFLRDLLVQFRDGEPSAPPVAPPQGQTPLATPQRQMAPSPQQRQKRMNQLNQELQRLRAQRQAAQPVLTAYPDFWDIMWGVRGTVLPRVGTRDNVKLTDAERQQVARVFPEDEVETWENLAERVSGMYLVAGSPTAAGWPAALTTDGTPPVITQAYGAERAMQWLNDLRTMPWAQRDDRFCFLTSPDDPVNSGYLCFRRDPASGRIWLTYQHRAPA